MKTPGVGNSRRARYGPWMVAAAFTVSGLLHLANPAIFTPLVPCVLPGPTELVYASGVVELICAVGLWRRDRWAGIVAAALLVIIWPANLQATITAQEGDDLATKVVTWIRLPLQFPLVWLALQSGRRQRRPVTSGRES
ncbi:MAG: DoxX family protein [Dermatophilaceae bacterium]